MSKLDNLEGLVSVVEAGSFSRAADRLNVAKSVVSRRPRALETPMGIYAVYPPGRLLPRRLEVLSAFLAQRLGDDS